MRGHTIISLGSRRGSLRGWHEGGLLLGLMLCLSENSRLCNVEIWFWTWVSQFRVFPFRSQNGVWFDFTLFYPLTRPITGIGKSNDVCLECVYMSVCEWRNSPSSPSRGSINLRPPLRLPSDRANKGCLAKPARKYLFWKLPRIRTDAPASAAVRWGIYTLTVPSDRYYICTPNSGHATDTGRAREIVAPQKVKIFTFSTKFNSYETAFLFLMLKLSLQR